MHLLRGSEKARMNVSGLKALARHLDVSRIEEHSLHTLSVCLALVLGFGECVLSNRSNQDCTVLLPSKNVLLKRYSAGHTIPQMVPILIQPSSSYQKHSHRAKQSSM